MSILDLGEKMTRMEETEWGKGQEEKKGKRHLRSYPRQSSTSDSDPLDPEAVAMEDQ